MTAPLTWNAEDILRAVHGQCLQEQSWSASGISIDSRSVNKGDLFIALKGPNHDGHDHVAAAFERGAVGAIVARQPAQIPAQAPLIMVEDTFAALEELGRAGRARTQAKIVAVTGSVGKTSSKEMLRLMLSAVGNTYANEGSLNNHWGVPLSLARLPQDDHFGVFELGMNHAGELTLLSKQAKPDVAMITTVEAVHLEFFPSVEAIADAKAEIFAGTKPDGSAVLNRDNMHFNRLMTAAKNFGIKKILSFGHDSKNDARILSYTANAEGGSIKADIMGKKIDYTLSVPGEHLAMNSLGSLLTAVAAGGDLEACAAALCHFQQPKGRGVAQTIHLPTGAFTLIDESYNASPVAVRAAITVLGQKSAGRKILALGDMRELGTTGPQLHAELATHIVAHKIDQVFTCGDLMAHLYEALPPALRGKHADNSTELAPHVAAAVQPGDHVTVKGSLSTQMIKVVETLKVLGISSDNKLAS